MADAEDHESSPDDPTGDRGSPADGSTVDHESPEGSTGGHEVTLVWRNGREASVVVPPDGTVLDAAEDAGIGLPFGCKTGACGTCTARLLSGEVAHRRPPRALKDRHREDGYVLACVATPTTDCRLEVGAAVADDLVENPWK